MRKHAIGASSLRFGCLMLVGVLMVTVDVAEAKKSKKKQQIESADDLQIVDCLLPGKVRRLGRRSTYVEPRRPIRTSAADCEIRGGDYVAEDRAAYSTALEIWLPAANAGDPKAQTYVGEMYQKGVAGSPDPEIAAIWYKRAAEQGYARAQINLALAYEQGVGVEADPEKAIELYRLAAGVSSEVVLDSRAEAEALRLELEASTHELEVLAERLELAESELTAAQAEIEAAQAEIDAMREQLEQAESSSQEEVARLTTELAAREAALASQREEVSTRGRALAEQRSAFDQYRARASEVRRASLQSSGVGPSIEFVRPDVLTTRGPALVVVPPEATEVAVTGRVTAPGGVAQLTVDGRPLVVESDGFFQTRLDPAESEVAFVARDHSGRTGRAVLVLDSETSGSNPWTSPGAGQATQAERFESRRSGSESTDQVENQSSRSSVALIIGVANYSNFPSLQTATADAEELGGLLASEYGFRVETLTDPSTLAILLELKKLSEELDDQDDLLIYFAGHGKIDRSSQRGFWIPSDAESDDSAKWIANETITDYLDLINARHILVIADSCYSGTMTRSGLARSADPFQTSSSIDGKRSRTVLSSGGLQPVLDTGGGDHSIFARALLTVLKLNDAPLAGAELHREVSARVTYMASQLGVEQVPSYAPIQFAGHEVGDYVLKPSRRPRGRAVDSGPTTSP